MSRTTQAPERGQASTQTIAVAATAMQTILDRNEGMPAIAALTGAPGLGKTSAAVYLTHPANFNSVYVSCRSFETTKSLALMLLKELGVAAKTHWPVSTAFDHICEALVACGRPLVVDEVDYISEKGAVNLLRDLHDIAQVPLFLIGEEQLKQKMLNHHERFHDRVLVWGKAVPADKTDLDKLIKHYTPGIAFEPDAKQHLLQATNGVARRIVTALNALQAMATNAGIEKLALAEVQQTLKAVR